MVGMRVGVRVSEKEWMILAMRVRASHGERWEVVR